MGRSSRAGIHLDSEANTKLFRYFRIHFPSRNFLFCPFRSRKSLTTSPWTRAAIKVSLGRVAPHVLYLSADNTFTNYFPPSCDDHHLTTDVRLNHFGRFSTSLPTLQWRPSALCGCCEDATVHDLQRLIHTFISTCTLFQLLILGAFPSVPGPITTASPPCLSS